MFFRKPHQQYLGILPLWQVQKNENKVFEGRYRFDMGFNWSSLKNNTLALLTRSISFTHSDGLVNSHSKDDLIKGVSNRMEHFGEHWMWPSDGPCYQLHDTVGCIAKKIIQSFSPFLVRILSLNNISTRKVRSSHCNSSCYNSFGASYFLQGRGCGS